MDQDTEATNELIEALYICLSTIEYTDLQA